MFTEFDAKYSMYHKPVWQGTPVPSYGTYEPIAPEPLYDEDFTRQENYQHLLNMSMEIIKDVYVKERHLVKVQRKYKADVKYKLGSMVAGTVEKFTKMAKIFRFYVRPLIYDVSSANERLHTHATISMIQGYQVMQGEYNELRIESELYFDFIGNNEKAEKENEETTAVTPPSIETIQEHIDVDNWESLSEAEQLAKIEEMKASLGADGGGFARRRMARGFKRSKLRFTPDAAQEEYKRSLRYQAWAKKWNGFNPKTEGIEISKPLAKLGRNMSKFLNVNSF
ncbi:unnamed protein product [Arctia plantaginis]|uniref:Uncharacterized protein n=1 Tax=Arctia plantaginis TaxID=874455 RepID=A0A8S1AB52_ARCPL|nr:unnamed protein product [Arctia plantaginis]